MHTTFLVVDDFLDNAEALRELAPKLTEREAQRAREIAKNLGERIEERRKAQPIEARPGETET